MRGADQADRDGIDDGAVATRNHCIEAVAIPCRARDLDEGAALRRGFQLTLARGHEGGRKLRDVAQAAASSPTTRPGAHAPETRRRKIPFHRRASMPASPATRRHRRCRRLPPPIRCRWNRRTRRPEKPATARSSAGTAPPPRSRSWRFDQGSAAPDPGFWRPPPHAAAGGRRLTCGHEHGNGRDHGHADGRDRNARHGDGGHDDDRHDHATRGHAA